MAWEGLYSQLSAMEALGVGRQGPGLNTRGERVLRYLQRRRCRERNHEPDWYALSNGLSTVMEDGTLIHGAEDE